jgi:hypothetical protein
MGGQLAAVLRMGVDGARSRTDKYRSMRFPIFDRRDLARLSLLLMPEQGWKISRKKKWRYLWRVLWEDRRRGLLRPSRYTANLDFWSDGDHQVPNNVRSPKWDRPHGFNFWTDGTDWVDAPEAIDNADEWELELQAMSRLERLKVRLQMRRHARLRWNDIILVEPSPRYDWFAYLRNREREKRIAAESRRIVYQPKKERPIIRRVRERLWREFAWAVEADKKQAEEWRRKEDPDNFTKRALAPHLSPQNLTTDEIEERIVAMSEAEWKELLELVCASSTWEDYQRIRDELLAKHFERFMRSESNCDGREYPHPD